MLDERVPRHLDDSFSAEVPADLLHLLCRNAVHIDKPDQGELFCVLLDIGNLVFFPGRQVVCIQRHYSTLTAGPMVVLTKTERTFSGPCSRTDSILLTIASILSAICSGFIAVVPTFVEKTVLSFVLIFTELRRRSTIGRISVLPAIGIGILPRGPSRGPRNLPTCGMTAISARKYRYVLATLRASRGAPPSRSTSSGPIIRSTLASFAWVTISPFPMTQIPIFSPIPWGRRIVSSIRFFGCAISIFLRLMVISMLSENLRSGAFSIAVFTASKILALSTIRFLHSSATFRSPMVFSCLFHEYTVVLAFCDEGKNLFGFLAVNGDSHADTRADDFLDGSLQLVGEHAFEFHVGNSYSGLEWQIACHNGVGLLGTFLDTGLFLDECRGR